MPMTLLDYCIADAKLTLDYYNSINFVSWGFIHSRFMTRN